MPQNQVQSVPVYWCDDPIMWSPCVFEKPCGICVAHSLGRKAKTPCLNLRPVPPAFTLPVNSALSLVNDGNAEHLNIAGHECIRLTFSKIAQLRDRSLKIDERFLEDLVSDHFTDGNRGASRSARAVVDYGWRFSEPIREIPVSDLAAIGAEPERIQSFA